METHYNLSMRGIGEILNTPKKDDIKHPRHEKSAIVDEIIKVVGDHSKYNYKYWLRMIGDVRYNEMLGMLKEVQNAPDRYAKGAILTNKLRRRNAKKSS